MQTIQYWYLKNHNLFSQLKEDEVKNLCIISGFKRAVKRETIYFALEPIKRIYLLKKGILKIAALNAEGEEIIKEIIYPGDIFGEIALNKNGPYNSEYAKVLSEEVLICSFSLDDFESVLKLNPNVSLKFTKQIGSKMQLLENKYSNLVFKDVRTRIVNYLKEFVTINGKVENNQCISKNYLTHQDLASLTGSTRQTVTSILRQLEKENKLLYSRTKITILDFINFS